MYKKFKKQHLFEIEIFCNILSVFTCIHAEQDKKNHT